MSWPTTATPLSTLVPPRVEQTADVLASPVGDYLRDPPGMVERAIEAAWPGAHTRTAPAKPPIPTTAAAGRRVEAVGGELRLARSEALPIRTEHPADPIRAMLGAPVGLGPHERACVQI